MIIKRISIEKFRGFNKVDFELGSHMTVISGQNGTQKTTILGMLSQSFSITDDSNPMRNEKPLCGGTYKSDFSNKFKFSRKFDKAGEHEWTLFFKDDIEPPYTVESIHRDKKLGTIRFWQKGNRNKGSGYIQRPVIYLSLKRLLPIAEDDSLRETDDIVLSEDELSFYKKWHNKILILTRNDEKVLSSNYISSNHKQTLGANTNHYDWQTNSAGQDNISKILLAVLSFKRLKEKYGKEYRGGILAIDEIDATLFSGSQVELIDALNKFASSFDIQIIFTTHSLTILKYVASLSEENHRKNQIKLLFLIKEDKNIEIKKNIGYEFIESHLNTVLSGHINKKKIDVYTEDKEGAIFAKSLLGIKHTKNLNFIDVRLGCTNLIQLSSESVPSFIFPNSIIILDGDVKANKSVLNKIKGLKNILLLPTEKSPEQIISQYLNELTDKHPLWENIDKTFSHQLCFKTYSNDEIQEERKIAKKWFNLHINIWGRNASKVLSYWKKENESFVLEFNDNFAKLFDEITNKIGI